MNRNPSALEPRMTQPLPKQLSQHLGIKVKSDRFQEVFSGVRAAELAPSGAAKPECQPDGWTVVCLADGPPLRPGGEFPQSAVPTPAASEEVLGQAPNEGTEQGEAAPPDEWAAELGVPLDPLTRTLSVPGAPAPGAQALGAQAAPSPTAPMPAALADQIALQLVRRFSAGSSGKNSAVRVEFSSGVLEGGTLLVSSDGGGLSIRIDAPPGSDPRGLAERIHQRLSARGLEVAEIEFG